MFLLLLRPSSFFPFVIVVPGAVVVVLVLVDPVFVSVYTVLRTSNVRLEREADEQLGNNTLCTIMNITCVDAIKNPGSHSMNVRIPCTFHPTQGSRISVSGGKSEKSSHLSTN